MKRPLPKNTVAASYNKSSAMHKKKISPVIVRQFDDGGAVTVPRMQNGFVEYDLVSKAMQASTRDEYDVSCRYSDHIPSPAKVSESKGLENVYVEPFEEPVKESPQAKDCTCHSHKQEESAPAKRPTMPKNAGEDTPQKLSPSPVTAQAKNTSSSALDEDDLLADMKTILSGAKAYDPVSKKMVDKADLLESETSKPKPAPPQKKSGGQDAFTPPLDKKDEHEIFNRIAKSMQYANAYDLGAVSLENRFKEFDEIEQFRATPKTAAPKTSAPVKAEPSREFAATTSDFIKDLDELNKYQAQSLGIPLDPGIGGRSISAEALEPGDIIISTTGDVDSFGIRFATHSEVSHSAVYIGNGRVIEAIGSGVLERTLETALKDDTLAVAYRHVDMTPEKAAKVVEFLKKAERAKAKYDYVGAVKVAPAQLIDTLCNKLPGTSQESCRKNAKHFRPGTDANNEFFCSELLFEAYRAADLNITDIQPSWSTPQDIVHLNHNGKLSYVGHLKV